MKIPSVIQLPKGIKLKGLAFRIIDYDADGRPKTFELLPADVEPTGAGLWTLWADEQAIRKPGQKP